MNKKHLLIMILCCLTPVAGLLLIRLFNLPVNVAIYFALMLLCPLSHIVLMKRLMNDGAHGPQERSQPRSSESMSCHAEPSPNQQTAAIDP
jgi:hypothetical protein